MLKMRLPIHIGHGFSINKRSLLGIISALVCLACIFTAVPAVSQTQLPNPIKLGVRTSAFHLGNNVSIDKADGFCGTFGQQLKKELENNGKRIKIEYHPIVNQHQKPKFPRYNGLLTDKINIECGPNSTISNAVGVKFSHPFHTTGVRLLLRKELADNLKSNPKNTNSIKIGVIRGTITLNLLQGRYNTVPYESGDEALDALDKNQVQAFASDTLIVWTLLEKGIDFKQHNNKKIYIVISLIMTMI